MPRTAQASWKKEILNDILKALRLPDNLSVSEWADRYRVLASDTSAESGKWKTSRTPYLKEIMDCLSQNNTPKRVVFMKGAQIGGTEAGQNWIGYIIHHVPGPTLYVNPTIEMAKRVSKTRITPMIEKTRVLAKCVAAPKSRDTGNTILQKDFKGGYLVMVGANAPTGLRSSTIRYLFLDEVDAFPDEAGLEGDPVDLAIQRTATYRNKKIFMVSTPTIKDASRIEQAFLEGDQRYYHVPCPKCGHYQVLQWRNIVFDSKNLTEACYCCENCKAHWHDWQKDEIFRRGHWIAKKPYNTDIASFHLSSLYSPHGWTSWTDIAREFLESKSDPSRLQVWTNTKLAESWEDMAGEKIDPTNLMVRREVFGDLLPAGVAVLTAGVDVQDNRLEVEIVGWGRAEESWSIDYLVLYGDPSTPELWTQLDAVLARKYPHQKDIPDLGILACCVDSGGHYTDQVINYCFARAYLRVFAIKGDGGHGKPIWPATASKNWKTKKPVYVIGVNDAKDTLMRRLHTADCAGCWHFPIDREREWFEQLTNEIVRKKFVQGRLVREWRPRKEGVRTEALDCRVYAYAALRGIVRNYRFNLDFTAEQIAMAGMRARPKPDTPPATPTEQPPQLAAPPVRRVRSKGIDL